MLQQRVLRHKRDWPTAPGVLLGLWCLLVVKARWPDSRSAFWKPGLKNGARRREVYEDRDARISILAGAVPTGRIR